MSLPLTPETLRATYDLLATTPPFRRWNLPDSEDIDFKVVRSPRFYGWYIRKKGRHQIAVSQGRVGRSVSLVETMAHEMVHLHQGVTCMETPGAQHNAAFAKLAAAVCRVHGFDAKLF